MTDITKLYPDKKNKATILISPAAEARVVDSALDLSVPITTDVLRSCVAASLYDFLKCDYMRRSLWFKTRPVHTFTGLVFKCPSGTETAGAQLVVRHFERGYEIISPAECVLPENYYEERVIEETKVLYAQLVS